MKTIKPIFVIGIVVISQLLTSCFPDHRYKDLRIKSFTWENVRYYAEYTHRGLLKKLKSNDRKIEFYYDENQKLYKTEIIFHGSSVPESVFEYVQGPKGITRITWSRNGSAINLTHFTYAADGKLTQIINDFDPTSDDPWAEHILTPTYDGNNVSKLMLTTLGVDFSYMYTESFDNKKSPFRMLAKSVNNTPFFPIGSYRFFQSPEDYCLPYITWLSENNTGEIVYRTVGGGLHQTYPMTYVYDHNLVTNLTWGNDQNPIYITNFEFEYGVY
jgi:hypothetical protein